MVPPTIKVRPSDTIMVCRLHNEASYMLERFLEHNSIFFDHFIALVDRSTDNTFEIVNNHPKCVLAINRKVGGFQENQDYRMLRTAMNYFNAEWMLFLDADELLSYDCIQALENIPRHVCSIGIPFVTLYENEHTMIINRSIHPVEKFFRVDPCLKWRKSLRCRDDRTILPLYILNGLVYHYNFFNEYRRQKRYSTYKADAPSEANEQQVDTTWIKTVDIADSNRKVPGNVDQLQAVLESVLQTSDESIKPFIQHRLGECFSNIFMRNPPLVRTIAERRNLSVIPKSTLTGT